MLFVALLQWWYGRGWLEAARRLRQKLKQVVGFFSVGTLLRTLFKPWRQITWAKDPNATLGQGFRTLIDNLVSRFVGLWVRLAALFIAAILIIGFVVLATAVLVVWPLLPPLVIWLIIRGVR